MAGYASLSWRDPEVRAFINLKKIDPQRTRFLYIRDVGVRSIGLAARNERIVQAYHARRAAGWKKAAAFRDLRSALELTLGPKQLGRIVAGHERTCAVCSPLQRDQGNVGGAR